MAILRMRCRSFNGVRCALAALLLLPFLWYLNRGLPTVYDYYTSGGVTKGLEADSGDFALNGRPISLFSGAMHYFRVPPQLWRDRLRRLRAAGLVAVETYVPWNLHNPKPDVYDFGDGGTQWSPFLDVVKFVQTAQEEDLLVLVRPGPYICAEWEFGGLPSWLLRDPEMKVRTSYEPYKKAVRSYFERLMPLLAPLHFLRGGPIVALQVENEYGALHVNDKAYLHFVKGLMEDAGLPGLFFTSDSPRSTGDAGALPGVLQTANFQENPEEELNALRSLQPGKPAMVMEYWSGWFDHWTEEHHSTTLQRFSDVLTRILEFPAGVNFYMFIGGTNWGFMNGANVESGFPTYQPDVTSYDYDAPLTEWGNYSAKYETVRSLLARYARVPLRVPAAPAVPARGRPAAGAALAGRLTLRELVAAVPPALRHSADGPLPMELLPANGGAGQSYGFLLYRRTGDVVVADGAALTVRGRVRDVAVLLQNGRRVSAPLRSADDFRGFGYWEKENASIILSSETQTAQPLELLVENWGRVNYGLPENFHQRKGLIGTVELDGVTLGGWEHISLQFDPSWLAGLTGWSPVELESTDGSPGLLAAPAIFRVEVSIENPVDTWIDTRDWGKGVIFVNGFALGRHLNLGPTHTLYWPAPLQKSGINEIMIFELFQTPADLTLKFSDQPILGNQN